MREESQLSDLQLKPDFKHERREWRVQRIGWFGLALFCGAALAGLLGPGPLSKRQEGSIGSELYFEYEKFLRHRAPHSLKVYCRPEKSREVFTLALDRGWIEGAEIKEIQPEPIESTTAGDKYLFHFKYRSDGEQLVTFRFEPDTFGTLTGTVALDENTPRNFKQFVWP